MRRPSSTTLPADITRDLDALDATLLRLAISVATLPPVALGLTAVGIAAAE